MTAITSIFLQYIRQQLRDKYSIFWNLAFPLLLLTFLALVFGGQQQPEITFQISLIPRDESLQDSALLDAAHYDSALSVTPQQVTAMRDSDQQETVLHTLQNIALQNDILQETALQNTADAALKKTAQQDDILQGTVLQGTTFQNAVLQETALLNTAWQNVALEEASFQDNTLSKAAQNDSARQDTVLTGPASENSFFTAGEYPEVNPAAGEMQEEKQGINPPASITPGFPGIQDLSYAAVLDDLFIGIEASEDSRWFKFHRLPEGVSAEDFLESEKTRLEQGERHLLLVIPEGTLAGPDVIELYHRSESQLSRIAADVITSILIEVNRELNIASGSLDRSELLASSTAQIELSTRQAERAGFSMAEYLVPGIILFTFLLSGLDIMVSRISSLRARGILRRYFATPLRPIQYFAGIIGYIIVLSLIQVILIYGWSVFFFNINLDIFDLRFIGYLLFGLIISLSFGFLVLGLVKSKESVGIITSAIIYPLAFLGGIFFPVTEIPGFIRFIVLINPVTYLTNGMRDLLGIYPSTTSPILNILVPAAWLVVGLIVSALSFKWNPGGEG